MKTIPVWMVLASLAYLASGCDHPGSGGHMMGGGMMGQLPAGNSSQTLPEPNSEVTRLFRQFCGQCHAPPSPLAHKAKDWPPVAARMKQHMKSQGKAVPNDDQYQEIIAYLQRHAG